MEKINHKARSGSLLLQYGKATFKRHERLHFAYQFQYMRNSGRVFPGRLLLLSCAPSTDGNLRAAVICGRKFSKKAVGRNRVRRLIRESFRLIKSRIGVSHIIFIPKKAIIFSTAREIQDEMTFLLKKAELWTKNGTE